MESVYNFTGTQVSVRHCVVNDRIKAYMSSLRSHDMPVLVATAQLCSTFVYERKVHVLNPLAHLEAIDSSVANTREREGGFVNS